MYKDITNHCENDSFHVRDDRRLGELFTLHLDCFHAISMPRFRQTFLAKGLPALLDYLGYNEVGEDNKKRTFRAWTYFHEANTLYQKQPDDVAWKNHVQFPAITFYRDECYEECDHILPWIPEDGLAEFLQNTLYAWMGQRVYPDRPGEVNFTKNVMSIELLVGPEREFIMFRPTIRKRNADNNHRLDIL